MDMRELTIMPREGLGKGEAKRLRRAGRTPGILYGGAAPVTIAVDPRDVFRIIHGREGSTPLLKLTFAGSADSKMAILRDMQFDPVSDDLIHVDLQAVAMYTPIQVTSAVPHLAEAVGVR